MTIIIKMLADKLMPFVLVLTLITLDIVCGVISSLLEHNFQSRKMREGLSNKVKEICILLFSYIADSLTGLGALEIPLTISGLITTYIVVMEIGSLAENIGFIMPDSIKKYLPNSKGE